MWRIGSCVVALVVSLGSVGTPTTAEACSYPAAEWSLLHRGNTLVTPAGSPVVVIVIGYENPFEELAPLTDSTFALEVTGDTGPLSGTTEVREAFASTARLVFTPDEPFEAGGSYQLSLLREGDENPIVLPLDVLDSVGGPAPLIDSLSLYEERRAADLQCCDTPEEDNACFMDDCGGFEFGECRLCWPTAYEYPVRGNVNWQVGSDTPATYLDHRVYRVDGESEELVIEQLGLDQASILWPADFDDQFCVRIEVTDVIRDLVESQTICSDDVNEAERTEIDATELIDRCIPGTIEDEVPDDDDDEDNDEDDDSDDQPGADKSEPGGCNTASDAPIVPTLLLLFLAMIGLRRVAPRS